MSLLQTLCYTCFALSGIFLIASIVLFFVWDIRSIIYWVTGRQKKETLKQMVQTYATTGSLRANSAEVTPRSITQESIINESLTMTERIHKQNAAQNMGIKLVKDVLIIHTDEAI